MEIGDRFSLTRRLGGADEGPVWEAFDRRANALVALKVRAATTQGVGLASQYEASRGLLHPGIARPLEFLRIGELDCLVMDVAGSGDLGTLRGRSYRGFLPHLQTIAQALDYLHSQGLVHGDLKPSNVLLDARRGAQLADFGGLKASGAVREPSQPFSPYSVSPQQRAAGPALPSDDVYSFGALLCELLSGQPPGYAAVPGGQKLAADVQPVQPAPRGLIDLMHRCLEDSPDQRPASMQDVGAELAAIAARDAPGAQPSAPRLTPPKSAVDVLRPSWQRKASVTTPDPKALQRQGFRSGVAVAVVSILALVALALFIVPARHSPVPVLRVHEGAPAPTPAAPPEDTLDLETLAKQKSAADEQRASVSARLEALRNAGSQSWATAATAAAVAALAAADVLMQKREYVVAQKSFSALLHDLRALEAQREPAFASALQRGERALQQGGSKSAAANFAQALLIRPRDSAAQRGARRAASLDAVFALVAAAKGSEQQGRIAEAASTYRKALALDPFDTLAQAGAARTVGQLQSDQFGRAMARAYAAIGQHRAEAARKALQQASQIKPDDPEIGRATAQLSAMTAATQLARALGQARDAETREHWQEAVTRYQQALALDSTLIDARHAMDIAAERARLDGELQQVIAHPERTYSDAVYNAARQSLQQAQAIAAPGPVLLRQISQVAELLHQAATPIEVSLRSDNLTSVTVYRVGALGNFTQRALQLKPGRYVIVGTRSGYRDVRRELNVAPGDVPPALSIQCVDPI